MSDSEYVAEVEVPAPIAVQLEVLVGARGLQGPPGEPGPQGLPGTGGSGGGASLLDDPPYVLWSDQDYTTVIPEYPGRLMDWTADLTYHVQNGSVFATAVGDTITFTEDCTVIIFLNFGAYGVDNDSVGNSTWFIDGTIATHPLLYNLFLTTWQYMAAGGSPYTALPLPPLAVTAGTTFKLVAQRDGAMTGGDIAGDGAYVAITKVAGLGSGGVVDGGTT